MSGGNIAGVQAQSVGDHEDAEQPDPYELPAKTYYSMSSNYVDWGPHEAMRELLQNCFDGVIKTNCITRADLRVVRLAKGEANGEATPPRGDTEIVYKIFHRGDVRDDPKCLGFVRYKGRDGYGTVEITNYGASLKRKDFTLGGTTKAGHEDQAGGHGEGFKLAGLVLMKSGQNHDVFGQSTGCRLLYRFDKDEHLLIKTTKLKDPDDLRHQTKIQFETPGVRPRGDIQFVIGTKAEGRNEMLEKVQRDQVSQQDFKEWTKVSLLLTLEDGDESVIPSPSGSLLTSDDQRGKLYLKGLLLRGSTSSMSKRATPNPLGFGYDFAWGETGRDRQSMADVSQQHMVICDILAGALTAKPSKPDIVGRICDVLNSLEGRYSEGEIAPEFWLEDEANDEQLARMFEDAARIIKQHFLEGERANSWLYSSKELKTNLSLLHIIEGMGRKPFELTDNLWENLAQHGQVHTVEEEARRWYKNARTVSVPYTSFATSLNLLIQACIRACPHTEGMRVEFVEFVDAGELYLDPYVSKDELLVRIHKQWLQMDSASTELGLVGDMADRDAVFYTVKRLFADVLDYLLREKLLDHDNLKRPELHVKQECHRAEQRVARYQRSGVHLVRGEQARNPGLRLEWGVDTPLRGDSIEVHVHRFASCSHLGRKVLITKDVETHMTCIPQKFDLRAQEELAAAHSGSQLSTCVFYQTDNHRGTLDMPGLQAGQEYFAVLVSPADPKSFVLVSNKERMIGQPQVRPNPSLSASTSNPRVAQASIHPVASASPPAMPAAQNKKLRLFFKQRQVLRCADSISVRESPPPSPIPEPSALAGEDLVPQRSPSAEEGPAAGPATSSQPENTIAEEYFSRGPRLGPAAAKDLGLPRGYEWYRNSGNVPAVIGIANGSPGESRKRLRSG